MTLDRDPLRRSIYAVLIAVSLGGMTGRIFAVNAVDTARLEKYLKDQGRKDWRKQRPFLSSNDRSRWATVRSLVELGTYQIDEIVRQPNWDTIDMVKHDGFGRPAPAAEEGHLYSSKPPLLPTLMAGPYWLIHKFTGATLADHPHTIGRGLLVLFNVLPMAVYFVVVARLVERFGASDWGRLFVMACATFGTFLSTFAVTINNHLTAAVSAAVALDAALRIWYDGERRPRWFAVAGVFAAFTAANELPALAFFTAVAAGLLYKFPAKTLLAFLPGALAVFAAAEGTNYVAHHSWIPAYAHRRPGDNWYDYQFLRGGKVRDSYWSKPEARSPIDQGEPERARYAFHVLLGHHGIFSLTPIWLLAFIGMGALCVRRSPDWRALGLLLAGVSLVCIVFYLLRPQADRNYGGMTSGFRWVFWFAPLWLVAMLPVADWLASRRWSRGVALALLGLSALSASYPTWNPWVHPWLLDFLESRQWLGQKPRDSDFFAVTPRRGDAPAGWLPGHRRDGVRQQKDSFGAALPQPPLLQKKASVSAACSTQVIFGRVGRWNTTACHRPLSGDEIQVLTRVGQAGRRRIARGAVQALHELVEYLLRALTGFGASAGPRKDLVQLIDH